MKIELEQHVSTGSIRTRLTLFYSIAVFLLLALAAVFLYWVTITLIYKADYEFLGDEVETIQYILTSDPTDMDTLKEAVVLAPEEQVGSIYRYFIRIYDENEHILIETPGVTDVLKEDNYLTQTVKLPGKKRYFWYNKNDVDYLLIQAPIHIGKKSKQGIVLIALDISFQHGMLHDRSKILAGLFVGTLISLLVGFFIANRGLRSLYVLTHTVQRITATSLNQRIDPKSWPVELSGLGLAFNQMLDRMEASFTRLKQFSADLSHELRTPITNLIGETEISLSYAKTVDEFREVMESNLEELHRISSLIENILFLAKAENPQFEIKKSVLHVAGEIALICEFYQAMADEKNIQITSQGDAVLLANPDMFRRLISNVLSNALKYTQTGGWVQFRVKELAADWIEISIEDNGIGIAAEFLPKLFDRFFRIDSARSELTSGVGLGLAIVKSIVDIHHGSIIIQSELNKGTHVTIRFPKMTKL